MTFEGWLEQSVSQELPIEIRAFASYAWEAATLAERERCAVVAWAHYMDTCKKKSIAPAIYEEWLCAETIRKGE